MAELFAGRVSVIERGSVRPYVSRPNALSLVWARGTLFAGTIAPTDGQGHPDGHQLAGRDPLALPGRRTRPRTAAAGSVRIRDQSNYRW